MLEIANFMDFKFAKPQNYALICRNPVNKSRIFFEYTNLPIRFAITTTYNGLFKWLTKCLKMNRISVINKKKSELILLSKRDFY